MADIVHNNELSENHPCHIFIVDDDEQQAFLMQEMAKTAQLESTLFTSSVAFLKTPITAFDIIVLDLQMPDKDGIEIMRELASNGIKPNFILVSGFDERVLHSAQQLAESKQLNVISTLTKPIRAKNFMALLVKSYTQFSQIKKQVVVPSPTAVLNSENTDAITLDDLKLAIRRHQLNLYLQPQVYMDKPGVKGAEVFVYWQHPTKGIVLPEHFIPLAKKNKLMNLLTEEVLRLIIKDYNLIQSSQLNLKISINLSAQNLTDLSMPEKLEALFKSHQIEPDSFILEISESSFLNEISDSLDILNRLRMKGFALSVDEFGLGQSSLVKLYQAPFSELKIDQHFITRMSMDHEAAAIVKICISLAKELKMQTVSESVTTEKDWNQLKKLGCDIAQGDYISKPMPIEAFVEWAENWEN